MPPDSNKKPGEVLAAILAADSDVTGKPKPVSARDLTARVTSPMSTDSQAAALAGRSPFLAATPAPAPKDAPTPTETSKAARGAERGEVLNVGDVLRLPNWSTCGGFRVWSVEGCYHGGQGQESAYEIRALDKEENGVLRVPCIILESLARLEVFARG